MNISPVVKQNLVIADGDVRCSTPRAVFQVVRGVDYIECTLEAPANASPTIFTRAFITVRLAKSGVPGDSRVFIECVGPYINTDFDLAMFTTMTAAADPRFSACDDVTRVILAEKTRHGTAGMSVTVTSRFNHLIQRLVLERQDFEAAIKEIFP
jgi:hypothetical protein